MARAEIYDPYDPVIQDNPYPAYRRLRDEAPLYRSDRRGRFWVLSRFADIWTAIHDHRRFSSADGIVIGQGLMAASGAGDFMPMMIMMDPPRPFGRGIHYCLGAALTRLECRVAYEELPTHAPDFELIAGADRLRSGPIRGYPHLPVEFEASSVLVG